MNRRLIIIGACVLVPVILVSMFLGFSELLRLYLGTIEYHVQPGISGDIYILSPTSSPQPQPGKYVYRLDANVVMLSDPVREYAGKFTGYIGPKEYPNICYPKTAAPSEYGIWLKGSFTSKAVPGYAIWVMYVGAAGDAVTLGNPNLQEIQAFLKSTSMKK